MSGTQRIFSLPVPPAEAFNRLSKKLFGDKGPVWNDGDQDGRMTPAETTFINAGVQPANFEPKANGWPHGFETMFRQITEAHRQERVHRELTLTFTEELKTDFSQWLRQVPKEFGMQEAEIPLYKRGMASLLLVAEIMQELYQDQIGFRGDLKNEEPATKEDMELISRYGHPWCMSDQSDFCTALPSQPERASGIYPKEGNCEQFGGDLSGLANPFSAVVYENGAFRSVPYSAHYREQQGKAAKLLRETASVFNQIPREKPMADYLLAVANTFESSDLFPYLKSDALWLQQARSNSLIFARVGADETGGDGLGDACGSKARFHMNIGLRNFESDGLINKHEPRLQEWENESARLIGNPDWYQPQAVELKLLKGWDVILGVGDDVGGPNGTPIGQTLPNWCGADGQLEPCPRQIMIYVNKTNRAYNDDLMRRYIAPLFAPETRQYFSQKGVGVDSVVLHEITHNTGPQQGKPKPGTDGDFSAPLQKWKGTFEELKAQNGSLLHTAEIFLKAREDFQAGKISRAQWEEKGNDYRRSVMYDLGWAVRMVLRATRNGKFEGNTYSRVAAIQLSSLTESGAIRYDEKKLWWRVDFEKMPEAARVVTQKTLQLYAEGDFQKADAFVKNAIEGDGFRSLHSDRINAVAGDMAAILFDYQVAL